MKGKLCAYMCVCMHMNEYVCTCVCDSNKNSEIKLTARVQNHYFFCIYSHLYICDTDRYILITNTIKYITNTINLRVSVHWSWFWWNQFVFTDFYEFFMCFLFRLLKAYPVTVRIFISFKSVPWSSVPSATWTHFSQTGDVTSYGSGWGKDIESQCLEFGYTF